MKRFFAVAFCFCLVFLFSACGSTSTTTTANPNASKQTGSFLKSFDGGKNWENKVKIDDKTNIGSVDVLSMAVDPKDGNIVYIGTESNGLFVTKDGAESWEKLVFPLTKIYGLAIDKDNSQVIYASGVLDKRAKIFKSSNGGKDWAEIYTEPTNDSAISSLEISRKNSNVLYCGTSAGMIFKSIDGGQSWKNLFEANGPIVSIDFDAINDNVVYFAASKGNVLRTLDGGVKIDNLSETINNTSGVNISSFGAYSVKADPKNSGIVYVGTDSGMYKGTNFGKKWEEVNIFESSKNFPIRAIAINPQNSNEIIYSNSTVIYRSVDGGKTWFTFQLNTEKSVQKLKYDPLNTNNIYAGLRKI